jgi:hypothetical protein
MLSFLLVLTSAFSIYCSRFVMYAILYVHEIFH